MISSIALVLAGLIQPTFAQINGTKVPVRFEVPADLLDGLPTERRQAITAIQNDVQKHLWSWDDVTVELPPSAFDDGAVIVENRQLFQTPDSREWQELTKSATGERLPLTAEHLQTIGDEALIIVPSQRFPGQNHVWTIHRFWQKGLNNITATFERAQGRALDQINVQIPNRFKPDGAMPNVYHGTENLFSGLKGALSSVIGLVETVPRFSDAEVTEILRREALQYVRDQNDAGALNLDLRLYDPKVIDSVSPVLTRARAKFERDWARQREGLLTEHLARVRAASPEDLARSGREFLATKRIELFHGALLDDPQLEAASPGIARLIVDRDRAVRITSEAVAAFEHDLARERSLRYSAFRERHRVKKFVPALVNKAVEAELETYRRTRWTETVQNLVKQLHAENLEQEERLAVLHAAFEADRAPTTRARLEKEREAARSISIGQRIWKSEDWIRRSHEDGDRRGFSAVKERQSVVSSDVPLWRLLLIGVRSHQAFFNQNYYLKEALRISARQTFRDEAFFAREQMNPSTGAIEPDPTSKVGTWTTRQNEIGRAWRAANVQFEERDDEEIIKRIFRPVVKARNGVLAAGASVGLAAYQAGAFICTSVFSCVGMAASPVTSVLYGVGHWASDALVLDSVERKGHEIERFAPLVWQSLTAVGGAGEVLVSAVAVPLHFVAAGGFYLGGGAQYGLRRAWDLAWFNMLSQLNLPTHEKNIIYKRTRGPGLEQNIEFKIEPSLALTALRAKFEAIELDLLQKHAIATIERANVAAGEALEPYRRIGLQPNGPWFDEIREKTQRLQRRTQDQFGDRRSRLPVINQRRSAAIRLRAADVAPTVDAGEKLARQFWEGRTAPDWTSMSLAEGDYRGLTEIAFQQVFGRQFLDPKDPSDDTLVIEQRTPDFARAFDDLIEDRPIDSGDVAVAAPDPVLAAEPAPDVDPRRETFGAGLNLNRTCENLLYGR